MQILEQYSNVFYLIYTIETMHALSLAVNQLILKTLKNLYKNKFKQWCSKINRALFYKCFYTGHRQVIEVLIVISDTDKRNTQHGVPSVSDWKAFRLIIIIKNAITRK